MIDRADGWRWILVAALVIATLQAVRAGLLDPLENPARDAAVRAVPWHGAPVVRIVVRDRADRVGDRTLALLHELSTRNDTPASVILLPMTARFSLAQQARLEQIATRLPALWQPWGIHADGTLVPGERREPDHGVVTIGAPDPRRLFLRWPAGDGATGDARGVRHVALMLARHDARSVPDAIWLNPAWRIPVHVALPAEPALNAQHVIIEPRTLLDPSGATPLPGHDGTAGTGDVTALAVATVLGERWLAPLHPLVVLGLLLPGAIGIALVLRRWSLVGGLAVAIGGLALWVALAIGLRHFALHVVPVTPAVAMVLGLVVCEVAHRLTLDAREVKLLTQHARALDVAGDAPAHVVLARVESLARDLLETGRADVLAARPDPDDARLDIRWRDGSGDTADLGDPPSPFELASADLAQLVSGQPVVHEPAPGQQRVLIPARHRGELIGALAWTTRTPPDAGDLAVLAPALGAATAAALLDAGAIAARDLPAASPVQEQMLACAARLAPIEDTLARLSTAIAGLPIGVALLDTGGRVLQANPAFTLLERGIPLAMQQPLHRQLAGHSGRLAAEELQELVELAADPGHRMRVPLVLDTRPCLLTVRALTTDAGDVVGLLAVLRDTTAEVRAARLRRDLTALVDADVSPDDLAAQLGQLLAEDPRSNA